MPIKYQKRLLTHLEHEDYVPKPIDDLADELRVDDDAGFARAVEQMADDGLVSFDKRGRVSLPTLDDDGELEGIFRGTSKGFGFVDTEIATVHGDIFVPPDSTLGALSGDRVRIGFRRDRGRERRIGGKAFVGEVIEITQRKKASFAGEMGRRDGRWLCYPDGRDLTEPILVRDAESKHVRPGDKVILEIIEYPEGGRLGEGVIVEVLGAAGEPDVETQAVIATYNLPERTFPEACSEQAREATRRFDEELDAWRDTGTLDLREDRTGEFITTIDPPDAKDYDDAIGIKRIAGGGWELGIHIADVAHFIAAGSALDVEGLDRGNSCYLPRLVIPMLPEILSNGICSLQEGVERYTKSIIVRYDKHGNVVGKGFCSSLIRSRKRMTYLEAQALIDGDAGEARKHAKNDTKHTDELIDAVREMDRLARVIRTRRRKAGMIHLDLPDVNLIFDDEGRVIDAEPEDDAFTHTIIEMFMVEANEAAARLFEELGVPVLRRVHPEPTPGETDDLRRNAKVAGYTIPKNPTREELQTLLDATRGTGAARAVHLSVLRTLTKAEYSPAHIGHFALASKAYAHFTSPIRRYPDLTVHRALAEYLKLTDNGNKPPRSEGEQRSLGKKLRGKPGCPHESDLAEVGRHCSNKEVNAAGAERDLRQLMVLQLLNDLMTKGENPEYAGVVTGVSPRGIYVQLDKYLADGMIKKEDLPGDVTRTKKPPRWQLDDKTGALVDVNSGRSYSIGDQVRVTVAAIDLGKRQMDLVIADSGSRAGGKRKGPMGLKLGSEGGGLEPGKGAGFKQTPGTTRRSRKSKQRDKGKRDYRQDRKGKKR